MKRHAAPAFATLLLLLPVLYVGSYLALVVPSGIPRELGVVFVHGHYMRNMTSDFYRFANAHSAKFFWPLEQIDRKLRPAAWSEMPNYGLPVVPISTVTSS